MTPIHSSEYLSYLLSPAWRAKRKARLRQARGRCEWKTKGKRCKERAVQCHHLTYKHLGHERLRELRALCSNHHKQADERRLARAKRKRIGVWEKLRDRMKR